ncbi:hypothetical protein IWQ62_004784 [Dispira parvispora]|uniref:Uncharacterized protein n=1 Tax=Dispira parvispora TaxID=1520584 RepID=A0A9W8E0A5_9FUNG|nr:hypothetical protein IWQ62_004784 [Dispira parvispora]
MVKYGLLLQWLVLSCGVYTSLAVDQYADRNKPPLFPSLEVLQVPPFSISVVGTRLGWPHDVIELIAKKLSRLDLYKWGASSQSLGVKYVYNRQGLAMILDDVYRISPLETGQKSRRQFELKKSLSSLSEYSYNELLSVHTNMQKAALMIEAREWLNPKTKPLDILIQELEKLNEKAAELDKVHQYIDKLKQEPFVSSEMSLSAAIENEKSLEQVYNRQKSVVLSKLYSESGRFHNLGVIGIHELWIDDDEHIINPRNTNVLKRIRGILEQLNGSYKADQMTWVPLTDLDDPVRRFLYFPLLSIRRVMTSEDFYSILTKAQMASKEDWLSSPGWKEVPYYADHFMFDVFVLDLVINNSTRAAHDFTETICVYSMTMWGIEQDNCLCIYEALIESIVEQDADKRKEKGYPDALTSYGVKYVKFQVNSYTGKVEWHLAMSTRDYKIRTAWTNLYKMYEK